MSETKGPEQLRAQIFQDATWQKGKKFADTYRNSPSDRGDAAWCIDYLAEKVDHLLRQIAELETRLGHTQIVVKKAAEISIDETIVVSGRIRKVSEVVEDSSQVQLCCDNWRHWSDREDLIAVLPRTPSEVKPSDNPPSKCSLQKRIKQQRRELRNLNKAIRELSAEFTKQATYVLAARKRDEEAAKRIAELEAENDRLLIELGNERGRMPELEFGRLCATVHAYLGTDNPRRDTWAKAAAAAAAKSLEVVFLGKPEYEPYKLKGES